MAKEVVDITKLIERIEKIRQGHWTFHNGNLRSSYRTNLGDKFDISLDFIHEEGSSDEDYDNYKLLITPKYNFKHNCLPIPFNGKDVKSLYERMNRRYKTYIEKLEKEDDCSIIHTLNKFLDNEE